MSQHIYSSLEGHSDCFQTPGYYVPTFQYKSDEHRPSFLLGIYIGVDFLSYKIFEYLASVETAKQFSKVVVPIYTPTSCMKVPVALYPCQQLIFSFLSILA